MAKRDSQRQKVYDAEIALRQHESNERFDSEAKAMKFIRSITESKRVENKYPSWRKHGNWAVNIRFMGGGARHRATATWSEIVLPEWAVQKAVIIHEIAHTIHSREGSGHRREAAHGREYCGIFLYLTRLFMGKDAYLTLRNSFRKHKVKYLPKRRPRPVTPEMIGRLAAARVEARRRRIAETNVGAPSE